MIMADPSSGTTLTTTTCRYCGAEFRAAHFCSDCGKIQPVHTGTDYFTFFGLARKLRLDEAQLDQDFYALSRQLHPDYFMATSDAERQASIERCSMLNDAYRTLSDRISRAQYLLSLEGYKQAEKKAPPNLLEEVFELNMEVEELKAAKKMGDEGEVAQARASLEAALGRLGARLEEIDGRLFELFGEWDAGVETGGDPGPVLDRISELLSHRSYIRNLVGDIKEVI